MKHAGGVAMPGHEADFTTSTFVHSDRDMHVTVEKPEAGYVCTLSMFARVPLAPDRLYQLLIDPEECLRIFKTLKRVRHRCIISDDGAGNRTVEVDQTGCWRFLVFRGTFTVRMIVEQRQSDRTIRFRLAKPGFMRDFTGTWCIRPFDNASLDQLVNRHRPSPLHRLQAGLRAVEQQLGLVSQQEESLVQLQQSLAPAFKPPPAVTRVLTRIAAKQITKIMVDLQEEVRRINNSEKGSSARSKGSKGNSSSRGSRCSEAGGTHGNGGSSGGEQEQEWQGRRTSRKRRQQQDKKALAAHVTELP